MKSAWEFTRFGIAGLVNTVVAYCVYLALLTWLRYEIAYAIAYAAGIASAYFLSTWFVFRESLRKRSALRFPLVYVFQFLLSLALLRVAIVVFGIPESLALAASTAVTFPATFLVSRWVVRSR